ncbi:MAG: anthranilate synthase component I, partial [Gammaproteobacteria bacterium]
TAKTVVRIAGNEIKFDEDGNVIEHTEADDPLEWIESFHGRFRVAPIPGLPRVTGGLVGYFGYDTVRYIEPRLANLRQDDPLGCADILLMVSDEVVVFDNLSGKLYIIVHANPEDSSAFEQVHHRLDTLVEQLMQAPLSDPNTPDPRSVKEEDFVSGFTREKFEDAVKRIKHYIVEGDVMQTVLSQRLSIPFAAPPLNLYRALRCLNPSPYLYYLDLDDFHIVGSSPEILVRLEDGLVTVRPIAGTRPRGQNEEEDQTLERDLLSDPKELAEHLMLIDLGRNDVGRVAEMGTVRVTEQMIIEYYSHVMHIVSNVTGKLKPGKTAIDVLRATFPAGTVSGAPKIRAMEIIDELEPVKRGVYAGAVGYLSWAGNMDTAIAIRTALIKDKTLHIQVGAGIVADSIPSREWDETMNKGRAIFRAVSMAEKGLNGQ